MARYRENLEIHVGDLRVKSALDDDGGVYLAAMDPDDEGDVYVSTQDLADAVAYVNGARVDAWL